MDLKQLVLLALQVSILCTVFGFGLNTLVHDLLYLARRPGLLLRSVLSVLVVMPVLAVAFSKTLNLPHATEVALVALAISPVPPFPGAQKIRFACGDCRSFHVSACSRPPLPITRIFIREVA